MSRVAAALRRQYVCWSSSRAILPAAQADGSSSWTLGAPCGDDQQQRQHTTSGHGLVLGPSAPCADAWPFQSSPFPQSPFVRGEASGLHTSNRCGSSSRHCYSTGTAGSQQAAEAKSEGTPGSQQQQGEKQVEEEEEGDTRDMRTQLLDASLSHVAALGWTDEAVRAGARDLGLSQASAGMLDRGAAELIEHHVRRLNREFSEAFKQRYEEDAELQDARLRDRIFAALKMRMEMNAPYTGSWPQALAIMGQPPNAPAAATVLAELMDEIWFLVGDTSVDSSWYTKRALLAGVYVATDLYMLTDTSPGYHDTWESLKRRLDEVSHTGGAVGQFTRMVESVFRSDTRP